jgi:hypothetical protein
MSLPPPDPIGATLDMLGIPDTLTNRQQLDVMFRALKIYVNRNEQRGDLWASFDVADATHHVRSKAARLMHSVTQPTPSAEAEALDSALDGINYNVFAARYLLGLMP